jgi:hypothetical protein
MFRSPLTYVRGPGRDPAGLFVLTLGRILQYGHLAAPSASIHRRDSLLAAPCAPCGNESAFVDGGEGSTSPR